MKKYKLKKCPLCGGEVKLITGEDKKNLWRCESCTWEGIPTEVEVSESEYLEFAEKLN